jgi:hypothetical protein
MHRNPLVFQLGQKLSAVANILELKIRKLPGQAPNFTLAPSQLGAVTPQPAC